jgi:hypothetical protein
VRRSLQYNFLSTTPWRTGTVAGNVILRRVDVQGPTAGPRSAKVMRSAS